MAVGYVSKPGSEYGPCEKACEHLDCKASRATAACVCRICEQPIGYDVGYLDEWYEQPKDGAGRDAEGRGRYAYFVHALCLIRETEAKRRKATTPA